MSGTRVRIQFISDDGKSTSRTLPDNLGVEVAELIKSYSTANPDWLGAKRPKPREHEWVFLEERLEYGGIGKIYQCKRCEGEIFSKGKNRPKKKHFETRLRMNVAIGAKKLVSEICPGEPSFMHEQRTEALIKE